MHITCFHFVRFRRWALLLSGNAHLRHLLCDGQGDCGRHVSEETAQYFPLTCDTHTPTAAHKGAKHLTITWRSSQSQAAKPITYVHPPPPPRNRRQKQKQVEVRHIHQEKRQEVGTDFIIFILYTITYIILTMQVLFCRKVFNYEGH